MRLNRQGRTEWPAWVKKSSEKNIRDYPQMVFSEEVWTVTEKLDGIPVTYTYKAGQGFFGKDEFYVCDGEHVIGKPEPHLTNVYWDMAEKYHMNDLLEILAERFEVSCVTVKGVIYGRHITEHDYGERKARFAAHSLIIHEIIGGEWVSRRYGTLEMFKVLNVESGVPCVPVVDLNYITPRTMEEVFEYAKSEPSVIDGETRVGIVLRSKDGKRSLVVNID